MSKFELLAVLQAYTSWLFTKAVLVFLAGLVLNYLINMTPIGRDDSDKSKWGSPDGRSDLKVVTDHKTHLQYLVTSSGTITPRLDASGKQMRAEE